MNMIEIKNAYDHVADGPLIRDYPGVEPLWIQMGAKASELRASANGTEEKPAGRRVPNTLFRGLVSGEIDQFELNLGMCC